MVCVTSSSIAKVLEGGEKVPRCRTWPEPSAEVRAECTVKVVLGDEMVPMSEGWPRPWGWKIVEVVTTAWASEGGDLKRDWLGSERAEKGCMALTMVERVVSLALCWKVKMVLVAACCA